MLYINNIKQRNGDNSVTVRDFSNSLRLLLWLPSRSTRSLYVVTLSRPPTISSMKITDCSFRCASPRPRNQLPGSFRQASPVSSRFTSSFIRQHIPHHPHSHHPPLLHSFTPGSKPIFSTNPSHLNRLLYPLDCLRLIWLDRTYHAHQFIKRLTLL